MEEKVKISVITPSFNQAAFLRRTLDSVAGQKTGFPVEHIVVDGASVDGTLDILRERKDSVRFVSEPDRGMPEAVNKGFRMAGGEILGWLNSDDIYREGALQRVADYFDAHPACRWLYGKCGMIGPDDRPRRAWITAYKNRSLHPFRYEKLLVENFISQPAVFFRRDLVEEAGPLDLTLPTAMDYDLWLRFAQIAPPGYIGEYLASFRVHHGSISARSYREQFEEQFRIHERYDRSPGLLKKHRKRIRMIVLAYTIMGLPRKLIS